MLSPLKSEWECLSLTLNVVGSIFLFLWFLEISDKLPKKVGCLRNKQPLRHQNWIFVNTLFSGDTVVET